MRYYHGGKAGLAVGDLVVPGPVHVSDGCYLCVARAEGRLVTFGEWRGHLVTKAARGDSGAKRMLEMLAESGAPDDMVVDPPSERVDVYVTTSEEYAAFYAARSKGDLYEVEPTGSLVLSETDHFPSWTVESARVKRVLRRGVQLTRPERRHLVRLWRRADKAHAEASS